MIKKQLLLVLFCAVLSGCASRQKQTDDVLALTGVVTKVIKRQGVVIRDDRKEYYDHMYIQIEDVGAWHGRSFYFQVPSEPTGEWSGAQVGDKFRLTVNASKMAALKDGDELPVISWFSEKFLNEHANPKEGNWIE